MKHFFQQHAAKCVTAMLIQSKSHKPLLLPDDCGTTAGNQLYLSLLQLDHNQ